jgi:hypothetical protein
VEALLENNITKPTYLGAFILAYSRKVMLENFRKTNPAFDSPDAAERMANDFFYTDTDSIVGPYPKVEVCPNVLGELDNDIKGKIIRGIFIAPKLYMLEYVDKDGEVHYHFRGKGVQFHEEKVEVEKFIKMHEGEAVEYQRDFQMKRIRTKLTSKQIEKGLSHFSITHHTGEETKRVLNKNPWQGRNFNSEGASVPLTIVYGEDVGETLQRSGDRFCQCEKTIQEGARTRQERHPQGCRIFLEE